MERAAAHLRPQVCLASLPHSAPEDDPLDREIDQGNDVDCEDQSDYGNDNDAEVPLQLRIQSTARNEEDHHVLDADDAKFVEELQPIVDCLLVRHHSCHVPEVPRLDAMEGENHPDSLVLEDKQSQDEHQPSQAKD